MWMIDIGESGDYIELRVYSASPTADLFDFMEMHCRGAAHETSLWAMVF